MMISTISTDKAPAAVGPYSQGKIANGFVYLSAQLPINPADGKVSGSGITEQTKRVLDNIGILLNEVGLDFSSVVKTTCYLVDMNDFDEFNRIYSERFTSKPARACVAVKALAKGALVEIDVIACRQ